MQSTQDRKDKYSNMQRREEELQIYYCQKFQNTRWLRLPPVHSTKELRWIPEAR
eukprot:c16700_g1_i1 orf=78-239(+)